MADFRLSVRMVGEPADGSDVRFETFLGFLGDVRRALHATDRYVSGSRKGTTYFTIADLRRESPATVVLRARQREERAVESAEAPRDFRDDILGTFVGGLSDIVQGRQPERLDVPLVLEYGELSEPFTREQGPMQQATIAYEDHAVGLDRELAKQVERIIGPEQFEHGSVSGMLDTVYLHGGKRYFYVFPIIGIRKVKCLFRPAQQDRVGEAIKRKHRYVTVYGRLHVKADSFHPHAVDVSDIEIHDPDNELPSLRDLRGIAPGATGNVRSEDFVRKLRDGWS